MLNKLYHVQITFSHSRVLTMGQQRACNHTVQNTETNSNYLFESMSSTDSHWLPILLSIPIFPQVSLSQGQTPGTFIWQPWIILTFNCMQVLLPFLSLSLFPTGEPPILFRYDRSFFKRQPLIKRRGSPGALRPSHSATVTEASGKHTGFK